jgi:hypothetical protein
MAIVVVEMWSSIGTKIHHQSHWCAGKTLACLLAPKQSCAVWLKPKFNFLNRRLRVLLAQVAVNSHC